MRGAIGFDNGLRRVRGKSFRTFVLAADQMLSARFVAAREFSR
jgi:hypothetical protein